MWYLYTCLVYSCSAWRHIAINYMYLLEDMCCWMIVQHQELGVSGGGSVSSCMEHKAEENLYVKMSNSQSWHPFFLLLHTYDWWLLSRGGGAASFQGRGGFPHPLNETLIIIYNFSSCTAIWWSHVHQIIRSFSMKLLKWAGGGELCRKWQRSLTPSHPQRSSPTLRKQATC